VANVGNIRLDVTNAGSPQISMSENGDNWWAVGADDADNFFKIKGSTTAMPIINNLTTPFFTITTAGNVGIGTITPARKFHVATGESQFDYLAYGVTPGTSQTLALATVEYVNDSSSENYLPLIGGEMSGDIYMKAGLADINMGGNNITNVNKLTAGTVDPLYRIKGINYSSFAPSFVGGVKEEYVGRLEIVKRNSRGEYEVVIDFSKQKEGSDLWVWRQVVDFSQDNVEVFITPYGSFANSYYEIDGEKLIIRTNRPTSVSYRLIGQRHDWEAWPTKAKDQEEKPSFIID